MTQDELKDIFRMILNFRDDEECIDKIAEIVKWKEGVSSVVQSEPGKIRDLHWWLLGFCAAKEKGECDV